MISYPAIKWLHLGAEDLGLEPERGTSFFSSSKRIENDLTQHIIPQKKEIFLRVKETVDEFDLSPIFSYFMANTGIIRVLIHNLVFSHSYSINL